MSYQHEQTARVTLIAFVGLAVLFGAISATGEVTVVGGLILLVVLAALGGVLMVFNRLTTTVDESEVSATFGWGWPSKRIPLDEIATVRPVRNSWWYGFGIRLTPHGWLYNVWGLDAVQLDLVAGKSVRIGTDEPEQLAAAVRARLQR